MSFTFEELDIIYEALESDRFMKLRFINESLITIGKLKKDSTLSKEEKECKIQDSLFYQDVLENDIKNIEILRLKIINIKDNKFRSMIVKENIDFKLRMLHSSTSDEDLEYLNNNADWYYKRCAHKTEETKCVGG